jgi:Flp pilus assembly protein TadG
MVKGKVISMKRKKRGIGERGVSAIEFALLAPFLFMLVFGVIEFGVMLYDKAMITNACREAARIGMVYVDNNLGGENNRLPEADIRTRADQYVQNHLISFGSGSSAPTVTIQDTNESFGNALTVRVQYQYEFLVLPNFVTSLMGPVNLTAEVVMRKEYQGP